MIQIEQIVCYVQHLVSPFTNTTACFFSNETLLVIFINSSINLRLLKRYNVNNTGQQHGAGVILQKIVIRWSVN